MPRKLNYKQTIILRLVLRFRYVTSDNLAVTRNITQNSAYSALEILNKADYLGKIYDKSFRLQNKSARYYLTQQAIDYLRKTIDINLADNIWISRKNDSKRSTDFIDYLVSIHSSYNKLKSQSDNDVMVKTALELYDIEGIIKPLPSLMVEPKHGNSFFVELTDSQHLFLIKKRIRKYIENYDSNDWEWAKYPNIYLIRANSPSDRSKLRQYIKEIIDDNYLDDDDFSFLVISSVDQIKI